VTYSCLQSNVQKSIISCFNFEFSVIKLFLYFQQAENKDRNVPFKGEWWRGWIQVQYIWYIVRTFVNVTMYPYPEQQFKKFCTRLYWNAKWQRNSYRIKNFHTKDNFAQGLEPLQIQYKRKCWSKHSLFHLHMWLAHVHTNEH
jgi:hypothetical protein